MKLLLLAMLGACRIGFEPVGEVAHDAATPPSPPAFVSTAGGNTTGADSTTLSIAMPQTGPGDLITVAFTIHDGASVVAITDDGGNTYVSAGARAAMAGTASELWYASETQTARAVEITMDAPSSFDAFTLEFAGVNGTPVAQSAGCLEYPPAFVTAPIATVPPDELIVTATMFAFPVFVSQMRAPFVGVAPSTGNEAGYLIAHAPGSYASMFDVESGEGMTAMTCASSAAWRP